MFVPFPYITRSCTCIWWSFALSFFFLYFLWFLLFLCSFCPMLPPTPGQWFISYCWESFVENHTQTIMCLVYCNTIIDVWGDFYVQGPSHTDCIGLQLTVSHGQLAWYQPKAEGLAGYALTPWLIPDTQYTAALPPPIRCLCHLKHSTMVKKIPRVHLSRYTPTHSS